MAALSDMTGRRFGVLTVTERVANDPKGLAHWKAQCDCGQTIVASGANLRSGNSKSCGCARNESLVNRNWRHGKAHTREHWVWIAMKQRCGNPAHKDYGDYGGRGITVCERWRDSFDSFLADMGPRSPGLTVERTDNDKGYEPGNCRWATRAEQASNRRPTRAKHGEGE